jgi:hypothetical protein
MAELELGRNLKADAIAEGNDVYFECRVRSNPPPHRFLWTHEVTIDCDGRYCLSNYLNFFFVLYSNEPAKKKGTYNERHLHSGFRFTRKYVLRNCFVFILGHDIAQRI